MKLSTGLRCATKASPLPYIVVLLVIAVGVAVRVCDSRNTRLLKQCLTLLLVACSRCASLEQFRSHTQRGRGFIDRKIVRL